MARGDGLRVRFSRIDETAKDVLRPALLLPAVVGGEFVTSEEASFVDYETVSAGEFSVAAPAHGVLAKKYAKRGIDEATRLRTLEIEAMAVEGGLQAAPFLMADREPDDVEEELRKLLRSGSPFEVLVTRQIGGEEDELRMLATMRGLTKRVVHGQPGVRYFPITLKEWRSLAVPKLGSGKRKGRGRGSRLPTKHTLTATDTLESLSRRYYGTPKNWGVLAAANSLSRKVKSRAVPGLGVPLVPVIGSDTPIVKTKRFKVGMSFFIPLVRDDVQRLSLPVDPDSGMRV